MRTLNLTIVIMTCLFASACNNNPYKATYSAPTAPPQSLSPSLGYIPESLVGAEGIKKNDERETTKKTKHGYVKYTRKLTKAESDAVTLSVKRELKDPDSAKFELPQLVALSDDTDFHTYCGTVNAKNSYGGYVGMKPFLVRLSDPDKLKTLAMFLMMDDANKRAVSIICSEWGYELY